MKNNLTTREKQIVHWLLEGASNAEIASELNIKEKTVKFHLTNIFFKEGVKSRVQLICKKRNYSSKDELLILKDIIFGS